MTAPVESPPDTGYSLFLSWGVIQWGFTGMISAAVALGLWLMKLGAQVKRLTEDMSSVKEEVDVVKDLVYQTDKAREALKVELLSKISDLPSRSFIEVQLNHLSARVDRMIDSKLGHN